MSISDPLSNEKVLGSLELIAHQVVEGFITGLHKSPFHGFSVEFAEHRLYNSGESVKNIDWKLLARTDKLFVKRFEEETNLRAYILLDHSSSMFFPEGEDNKMNFSIKSAAALFQLLGKQRDAFALSYFSNKVDFFSEAKSTNTHKKQLFFELEKLLERKEKIKSTNISHCLHEIAEKIHKRSLVIIFSDMVDRHNLDELFSALQHLKYNKHEIVLFNVEDSKKELDFDFENKPYIFVDLENAEEIKLFPKQIKEKYIESKRNHRKLIKDKCAQFKIDFVEADIHKGYDTVLRTFLLKRNKML